METISEKLARAQQTYSDALQALEETRNDFVNGSGKDFADILEEVESLKSKIRQSEMVVKVTEKYFHDTFRAAGYERTEEVNQALRAKVIEAEALEELRAGLDALSKPSLDQEASASMAADKYRNLYLEAYKAWVRVQAYEYLSEHGEALGRVMALAKHVGTVPVTGPNGFRYYDLDQMERVSDDVAALRQAFVLDAIRECGESHPENESPTMPPELGVLDLGPFNSRPTMTIGEINRRRIELGRQVNTV